MYRDCLRLPVLITLLALGSEAKGQEAATFAPAGHSTEIEWATWSPDGTQIATSASDRQILIWDAQSGHIVRRFPHENQLMGRPLWSGDGKRLMVPTISAFSTRLWDVATGKSVRKLSDYKKHPGAGWLNADGTRAILPCDQGKIGWWDVATGELRLIGPGAAGRFRTLVADDSGVVGLADGENGGVLVYDLKTGNVSRVLKGHKDMVNALAITRDGTLGASCSNENLVILWDLKTGEKRFEWKDHSTWVQNVEFSADGARLLSSDSYKTFVWDTKSGALVKSLDIKQSQRSALRGNGLRIATTGAPWVTVWDLESGQALRELKSNVSPIRGLAVGADGRRLFTGSDDGAVVVWDMTTGTPIKSWLAHEGAICRVSCDERGERVATASTHFVAHGDSSARVWNATSGEQFESFGKLDAGAMAMSLSPDGTRLLSCKGDKEAYVFDSTTGERRSIGSGLFIKTLGWNRAGETCWIGSSHDHRAQLVDWKTGKQASDLTSRFAAVHAADFSLNGQSFLTGHGSSSEGHAILWDIANRKPARTFVGHKMTVKTVCFSPDGERVVTACEAGEGRVWSVKDGRQLALLSGHAHEISGVAWHPQDRWIATSSLDGTVRLWNSQTGAEICRLISVAGGAEWIQSAPDGRYYASFGALAKANLYQADSFFQKSTPDLWSSLFPQ